MDFTKQFSSVPDNICVITSIVRAPCDMEIPGRTVQLIAGQLDNPHGDIAVMLVEPLLHFPDHLCVGCSLSSVFRSQVAIQIMNISPSPIKIYKGIKLGTATPEQNIFLFLMRKYRPHLNYHLLITCTSQTCHHLKELNSSICYHNFTISFHQLSDGPTGHISVVTHTIPTTGPPICQPLRQVPESLKDTVKAEVHYMLEHDIIRPSASPWSSPVVMVRKSDGSWHFCVDCRKLNSVTHIRCQGLMLHLILWQVASSSPLWIWPRVIGRWRWKKVKKLTKRKQLFLHLRGILNLMSCHLALPMPLPPFRDLWNVD